MDGMTKSLSSSRSMDVVAESQEISEVLIAFSIVTSMIVLMTKQD